MIVVSCIMTFAPADHDRWSMNARKPCGGHMSVPQDGIHDITIVGGDPPDSSARTAPEKPFIADHSKFARAFGDHSTPHRTATRSV